MGITIGSASGAYGNEGIDAGKINPSPEDAEKIAEERQESIDAQREDGTLDEAAVAGSMTGTLETSDPNNPEDADDVTPSKEDPSIPEGDLDGDEDKNVPPGTMVNDEGQIVVNEAGSNEAGTTPADAAQQDAGGPDPEANPAEDLYDPADHSVNEVEEYLATASDEEKARVIEAETQGKNRKGITSLA